jgi:hypothetical protein
MVPLLRNYRTIRSIIRGSYDMVHGTSPAAFQNLLRDARLLTGVRLSGGEVCLTCNDSVAARCTGVECAIVDFDSSGLPRRLEARVRRAVAGVVAIDSIATSLRLPPGHVSGGAQSTGAGPGYENRNDSAFPLGEVRMRNLVVRREVAPRCSAVVKFPDVNVLFPLRPFPRSADAVFRRIFGRTDSEAPCNCAAGLQSLRRVLHFLQVVQLREGEVFVVRNDTVAARSTGVECRINGFFRYGLPRSMDVRARTVLAGRTGIDSVKSIVRILPRGSPEDGAETCGNNSLNVGSWGLRVATKAPAVRVDRVGVMDSLRADAEIDTLDSLLSHVSDIASSGSYGSVRARLRLAAVRFVPVPGYPLKGLSVMANVQGDLLEVSKAVAQCYGARVEASGRYALRSGRLVQGKIDVRGFDLGLAYRSLKSSPGACAGTADLTIDLCPGALQPDWICGHATIKGAGLVAHNLPLQQTRDFRRIFPNSSALTFSIIDGEADLRRDRITIPGLWAQGDPLSFIVSGAIGRDGKLQLQLYGWLPTRYVATLPLTVRESLVPELYDNYSFKCGIGGTFAQPVVTLDRSHYRRAVKGVVKHVGKGIRKFLERTPRK